VGKTKGAKDVCNAKYGSSGIILGQGRQDQGHQSLFASQIRFFAEIGLLYAQTTSVLQKKTKVF